MNALAVFTFKSIETILAEGGSAAWKLRRSKARQCEYLVCTRNARADLVEGPEPHASAFLVGRVSDVVAAPDRSGRSIIKISEYALVDVPNVWEGWRNPVRYSTLEELGIEPDALSFKSLPAHRTSSGPRPKNNGDSKPTARLTIPEAKHGLAATYSVRPEQVEIIIRG